MKSGKGYSKQFVKLEDHAPTNQDDVMSIHSSTDGGDRGKGSGEP